MDIADEITAARDCGEVHCGLSAKPLPTLAELATEFGLSDNIGNYREIDAASARRHIEIVLYQNLAYKVPNMSAALALDLAERFLAQFGTEGVRFFTNGTFRETPETQLIAPLVSWTPVTSATFDTGVLILGPRCSGCLWIEDED